MKNRRGQMGIAEFIMIAIAAIVGVILLAASAQNIHPTVNTVDIVNYTQTLGAINTKVAIPGQAVVGAIIVHNITDDDGSVIGSGNYSITDNDILDSSLTATFNVTDAAIASTDVNLSYTSEPDGYSTSSGARAIARMIIIFFALAIAVVVLVPTLRSKILESMGK